ncbi:MAG: hypothetical protein JW920_07305 [Deltaproteobacteria bacterium]|nr:hypothetical protein [Deltaproteobacteria bacterium]
MKKYHFIQLFTVLLALVMFGCGGSSSEGSSAPSGIFLPESISLDFLTDDTVDYMIEFDFETLQDGLRLTATISADPETMPDEVGAEELIEFYTLVAELNTAGNPTLFMCTFNFDETQNMKQEYTYDDNGYLIEEIYYEYDKDLEELEENEKSVYSDHDPNGNPQLEEVYYWDGSQWDADFSEMYTSTYDENNNMLEEIDYEYEGDDWVYQDKDVFTYDDDGNVLTQTEQSWVDGGWQNDDREVCTYDDYGNMTSQTNYTWDDGWELDGDSVECTYTIDDTDKVSRIDVSEDEDQHRVSFSWQQIEIPCEGAAGFLEDMTALEWLMMALSFYD